MVADVVLQAPLNRGAFRDRGRAKVRGLYNGGLSNIRQRSDEYQAFCKSGLSTLGATPRA